MQQAFSNTRKLARNENQAYLLGQYAIDFIKQGKPSQNVLDRCKLFHTDSVFCGISALAMKTNAPTILKAEALSSAKSGGNTKPKEGYSRCLGSDEQVPFEKAVLANASAVREWDSNGTVFGYNPSIKGHIAGEFGHNDFYSVVIAASHQNKDINGDIALKAMVLQDEIRGRLCEVFSLKTYKIDHVVHGAIASICTYGALMGATPEQIEHAIGMFCAHYIPFRAIRAGKQLSDSKGASAAISTEAALLCIKRAMNGFIGPKDIFRNPEAIFRLNEPTKGDSPFDIVLSMDGEDFAVMGMHFKLGLYEHQSAGALEGVLKLLFEHNITQSGGIDKIKNINIVAYEPAFGIIGDPAKRNPTTRQSADHSMVYIVSTLIRKAYEDPNFAQTVKTAKSLDEVWKLLMLSPYDYGYSALFNKDTRNLMEKCTFTHGGKEYDDKYPEGIPSSVQITLDDGKVFDSKFVMFPSGHARNATANLNNILDHKFKLLGKLALQEQDAARLQDKLNSLDTLSNQELQTIYSCNIKYHSHSIDDKDYKI